jgi:hypothetical protein
VGLATLDCAASNPRQENGEEVRSRSRRTALYTSRDQDSTQTISASHVFDVHAGEEMFQLFDVLLGRGIVLPLGCQFHDAADF